MLITWQIFCVTSTAPIKAISFWISLIRITPVPLRHGVLTTCRPMPALSLGRLKTIAGAKGASRSRRKIITLSYVVGSAVNIVTDWVGCAR